ncbi:transcriptional repressor scratch 1-like isoform X2 [Varroa jacobsoni]|nr:transcriptional repressor scratch 1-like isoform X2 [Varroa jacobsoni]
MPRSFLLCHRRYKHKWRLALRHAAEEMGALDVEGLEAEICLGPSGELPSFSLSKSHPEVWHEDDDALGGYDSATSAKSFTDLQPAAMSPRSDSSGDCVVPQLYHPTMQASSNMQALSVNFHRFPFMALEPPRQDRYVHTHPLNMQEGDTAKKLPGQGSIEVPQVESILPPPTASEVGTVDDSLQVQAIENSLKRGSMMDALLEQVRAARKALRDNDPDTAPHLKERDVSVTSSPADESRALESTSKFCISPPHETDMKETEGDTEDNGHSCCDCGDSFESVPELEAHRSKKQSSCKRARRCPHCEKMYVSLPALSMHIRTHGAGCQCPYCGKRFSRPWLLQGHIR